MILSQFLKSLFVILKLQEFLVPQNLCFLLQEDEVDNFASQFPEIVSAKVYEFLTCAEYDFDLIYSVTRKNHQMSIKVAQK